MICMNSHLDADSSHNSSLHYVWQRECTEGGQRLHWLEMVAADDKSLRHSSGRAQTKLLQHHNHSYKGTFCADACRRGEAGE